MSLIKKVCAVGILSLTFALAACGGGGGGANDRIGSGGGSSGGGTGGGGGGTTPTPTPTATSITLVRSSNTIPADADDQAEGATITAILTDSNRNAVSGASVTFSANSGNLIVTQATTDASGAAKAVITTGGDTSLRSITITVSSASVTSQTTAVQVVAAAPVIRMGVLSGASFTDGSVSIPPGTLAAGASTTVQVNLVDTANGNALVTDPVSVAFTSQCVANGQAQLTSPVVNVNGTVSSNYQAQGCAGNDLITATLNLASGATLTATGRLTVAAAVTSPGSPGDLGGISFVSATPSVIGLQGSGTANTSTVVFKVVNGSGQPLAGRDVAFALNTTSGGISLTSTCATSNSSGNVQTVVRGGTVHTPVTVTATADSRTTGNGACSALTNPAISAPSSGLVVSTGIPDQDSFSMALTQFNIEGASFDGLTSTITVRMADRFNNPVPAGTPVAFTTECGSVEANCSTAGSTGSCSVKFTSQNPRQADGRCTVLATAIGEESFIDSNGNGFFDATEPRGVDLPEAFRDDIENGSFDAASETFIDFSNPGTTSQFDAASGNFTGVLCVGTRGPGNPCDTATQLHVRQSAVVVMSSAQADILAPASLTLAQGNSATVNVGVGDLTGNQMAPGTTITATYVPDGTKPTATIVATDLSSGATYTQVDTTAPGPGVYRFTLSVPAGTVADPNTGTGRIVIAVTSPGTQGVAKLTTTRSIDVTVNP